MPFDNLMMDARGALQTLIAANCGLDEVTGFCTVRVSPEFLKYCEDISAQMFRRLRHVYEQPQTLTDYRCLACAYDLRDDLHFRVGES